MLKIEIDEPTLLKRVHVQEKDNNGEIVFWAHISMEISGEYIGLSSDGEFDNSLFGEFGESYKGITEEEAIEKFVSYMKENA